MPRRLLRPWTSTYSGLFKNKQYILINCKKFCSKLNQRHFQFLFHMETITNLQLSNSYKITLSRKCVNANLFYQWSYDLNLHWQRLSEIRLTAVSTRLLVIYFEQYFITTSTRNIGFLIYWISGEVLGKVPLFRIGTPPYYWVSYTTVLSLLYRVHFFTISSALFCTI